jgi:hypothetical protein
LVPPPIVVPSPVGVGRLPEQMSLCVASNLVDLGWSSRTWPLLSSPAIHPHPSSPPITHSTSRQVQPKDMLVHNVSLPPR